MTAHNSLVSDRPRFLHNAWYAAAWSEEISTETPLGRRFLGQPVVLFRDTDGSPAALGDRCPHRFAPLHKGTVCDGQVRCGYHGLGFDRTGQCVHNPHSPDAKQPRVRVYPLVERDGLLWIWMGEEQAADPAAVPRFECLDETRFFVRRGYLHGHAHYELMVDNILDLSHIEYLHPALGTPAVSKAKVDVSQREDVVITTRRMEAEVLPPGLARVYRAGDRSVTRTMEVQWRAPSNLLLTVTIDHPEEAEFPRTGSQSLHLFTPETERSAHYFYSGSISRETADQSLFDQFAGALAAAFLNEDKPMIDAQQAMIGDAELMDLRPMLMMIDRASVMARRNLKQRIDAEATA